MDSGQPQTETKTCTKCKEAKPVNEYILRTDTGKRRTQCQTCRKTYFRDRGKTWYQNNREHHLANVRLRNKTHRKEIQQQSNRRKVARCRSDPTYLLECRVRNRCYEAIRNVKGRKTASTITMLGCTVGELRKHLEGLFYEGMTWDDYGYGPETFQIDHIIPIRLFDLTKPEEQFRAFHYTNLQPLWWDDHQIKTRKDMKLICIKTTPL